MCNTPWLWRIIHSLYLGNNYTFTPQCGWLQWEILSSAEQRECMKITVFWYAKLRGNLMPSSNYPDSGGSTFLWNVSTHVTDYICQNSKQSNLHNRCLGILKSSLVRMHICTVHGSLLQHLTRIWTGYHAVTRQYITSHQSGKTQSTKDDRYTNANTKHNERRMIDIQMQNKARRMTDIQMQTQNTTNEGW